MGTDLTRLPLRQAVVFLVNLASAALTLFTGLRENPIIVFVTGRYDEIRARLNEGRINYRLVRDDLLDLDKLTNLTYVGQNFRFFTAPTRSPDNLGEDRSTCMRVNSINVTHAALYFDDFWGKGARRVQYYFHSISAPKCDIINFTPSWYDECIETNSNSTDGCYRYMLDNFDDLMKNRVIQSGVRGDFGVVGKPFMRCIGRPDEEFNYITDLLVQQSFWAGGSYHVQFETSNCLAVPRLINDDKVYGLFQTEPVDQKAEVKVAIDNTSWFTMFVAYAYGIVTLILIARGLFNTIIQLKVVVYVPSGLRFGGLRRYLRFILPFMWTSTLAADDETALIPFKGKVVMASDVWINHWLYMILSMLDALVSIRTTYSVYEMGTWMLSMHVTVDNFVFIASAITRLTWLMCLIHSIVRLALKVGIRSLKALKLIRSETRQKLEWYLDGSALFLSYKAYSLLLCFLMYMLLKYRGSTSFMVNAPNPSRGVFGGAPDIMGFWQNEIMCDFTVLMCILLLCGSFCGLVMLFTKYRFVANNNLLRLIQRRYVFIGWDVFTVIQSLGIDPFDDSLVEDEIATTNCSIGCVIQQMFQSGPSGWFTLAADYLFYGNGFLTPPQPHRYRPKKAASMGLLFLQSGRSVATSKVSAKYTPAMSDKQDNTTTQSGFRGDDTTNTANDLPSTDSKSLFDKKLRFFAESTYGRVVLVDEAAPGKYGKSESGLLEYVVMDALSTMNILDVKHLLGNTKKLHIR